MAKIVILGASGLFGSELLRVAERRGVSALGLSRSATPGLAAMIKDPSVLISTFGITPQDYLVNAIGVTKQQLASTLSLSRESLWINSGFPALLARAAGDAGARVIQIGTDCVFSGSRGLYNEDDVEDAKDPYGLSKAKGERGEGLCVVRTSFVGPSASPNLGLWGWVQSREFGAFITGYTNQLWNGATTTALAELVISGFLQRYDFPTLQHLVPEGFISKGELVKLIARRIGRFDITIEEGQAAESKDMRLSTLNPALNRELWALAGYTSLPDIPRLISEANP